jgi:hypothetical protein
VAHEGQGSHRRDCGHGRAGAVSPL